MKERNKCYFTFNNNDEYNLNTDAIHEKKCGKAGTIRRQPAPFIHRIRVTRRNALFYTRTLSPSASVAPSKLSNRLACLQLQCHNTPHNHSSSAGSDSPSEYLRQLRVVKPASVCYVGFGGGIGKHLHNPQICAWARAELRNGGAGGGVSHSAHGIHS